MLKSCPQNTGLCSRHSARRLAPTQCAGPPSRRTGPLRAAISSLGVRKIQDVEDSTAAEFGFSREDWRGEFKSVEKEQCYHLDSADITGSIPEGLRGAYYRNGPGRFDTVDGRRIKHPFDGDGHILSIEIRGKNDVIVRNKFVRTEGFISEQENRKTSYRNVFGTEPKGQLAAFLNLNLKNTANTNVLLWGKGESRKMLALWEASHPYRLDAKSLETLGLDHLDDVLSQGLPFSTGRDAHDALFSWLTHCDLGGWSFCAHPHVDPKTNHLIAFALQTRVEPFGKTGSGFRIFEFSDTWEVISCKEFIMDGLGFIHDFCFTDDYYILFQGSVALSKVHEFLSGSKSACECLTFLDNQPSKIYFIPRRKDGPPIACDAPPLFVFHHANAYQEADQARPGHINVTMHSVAYPSLPNFEAFLKTSDFRDMDLESQPRFLLHEHTFCINEKDETAEFVDCTQLLDRCVEFPSVHPQLFGQRARFIYAGCSRHPHEAQVMQGFLKYDRDEGTTKIFTKGKRYFSEEPIFVPRANTKKGRAGNIGQDEDEGWLLGLVYNAAVDRSELCILDAKTMEEVACIRLKTPMPFGLHATWEWANRTS